MYKLLVVDNEARVVDSLIFYFEEQKELELEVYSAYSAKEALYRMEQMRIDILLADICMPGMDGLELQKQVVKKWPWCKTIFLTGYQEFSYVQQAIQTGGIEYLLKTEGKERIIEAVKKAMYQIDESTRKEDLFAEAQRRYQEALPYLRQRAVQRLIMNDDIGGFFEESASLDWPVQAGDRFWVVVGIMNNVNMFYKTDLAMIKLEKLAQEHFRLSAQVFFVQLENGKFLWLITPNHQHVKDARIFIQGSVEAIKEHYSKIADLQLSLCIAMQMTGWNDLPEYVNRLVFQLNLNTGKETGLILLERETGQASIPNDQIIDGTTRSLLNHILKLNVFLDNGSEADFMQLFGEMTERLEALPEAGQAGARAEFYYGICHLLTSYINRWQLHTEVAAYASLNVLYHPSGIDNWTTVIQDLQGIVKGIFSSKEKIYIGQNESIEEHVNRIIQRNIGGDLSLPHLGEIEGLNPYYLARVYHQTTGVSLTAYISQKRLEKAKEMLEQSDMINRDVAHAVGFTSEQAFHRFFKKMACVTPNDYRKSSKKDN